MVIDVETRFQRDAVEELRHVLDGVDGHPDPARLAGGQRVVRVVPDLRGEIEGDAQPAHALVQQIPVAPVGFGGRAESGILPHRPETSSIHRLVDASGERVVTGGPELVGGVPALEILGRSQL